MSMAMPLCPQCQSPSTAGSLAGNCPRCLAELAFGPAVKPVAGILHRSGDFEFLRELGRGGMGVVYEALQVGLNRRVAVKMLLAGVFAGQGIKARFQAEAEAVARLRHPNIVTIHEVGELDGQPYFAMELMEGPTLAELVREKPIAPVRAARYLRLVAEAIAHAHAAGVLHRDLKPSNILLDPCDQPRVTDFGLAKQLDARTELTRTGEMIGSPNYLPPEQISGAVVGQAGDVYSLGAILYQLLTARPPFVADTVAATLQQALHTEPAPPRHLNSSVPRDLETICLKCLQKEPGRRYSTAAALAEDLARFERSLPILARPISTVERGVLWTRRKPALAFLSLSLALAVLVGFASVLWQWREARASRERMRLNLYAADLATASFAERQGNLGWARSLLERHVPGQGSGTGPDLRGVEWRLLWQRCQSEELATLGTHPWTVTCVAVSPDGRWLASGSHEPPEDSAHSLKIWDLASRECVATLEAGGGIWSVAFTADSQRLMSAGRSGVKFWEAPSGRAVPNGLPLKGQTAAMAIRAPVLVASPWHPFANPTPEPLLLVHLDRNIIEPLPVGGWFPAVSPDGRQLAFLDARHGIQLWDLEARRFLRMVATNRNLFALRFSPDGRQLAAAGRMTDARVWDLEKPDQRPQLFPHERNVWLAEFSPDGRTLLTTGSDQKLRLWDLESGALRREWRGHVNEVWTAAFDSQGGRIASGGKDLSVRLWSAEMGTNEFMAAQSANVAPLFSPDGSRLVTCTQTNGRNVTTEWTWNESSNDWSRLPRLGAGNPPGRPMGFAPDGRLLIFLNAKARSVEWWEPGGRVASRSIRLEKAPGDLLPKESGVSGDGSTLFAADAAGVLWLWDTRTGALRRRISDPAFTAATRDPRRFSPLIFSALAMDREGLWLVVGFYSDYALALCEVATGRIRRLAGHSDRASQLAISPDGRTLASGSVDGSIRCWDVRTARLVAALPGHLEETSAVAFSQDGRTLASANLGMEVKLWHLPTLREVATFPLLNAGTHLAFSPDGRRLAINTSDGAVIVWDASGP